MPIPYLTKSDFKMCRDCRTKLYYRKNGYPTNLDENEYLELLARGGFMVELVAKARYPGGIDLVSLRDPVASFEETRKALAGADIVLFEAAATVGLYHVRADILRKEGEVLHLIEVKSSSVGAKDFKTGDAFLKNDGTVKADWKEYIEDIAFQHMVLRQAFPQFRIVPYLTLVDKRELAREADTLEHFHLVSNPRNPKARPEVTYHGDLSTLAQSRLLITFDVTREVAAVAGAVAARATELAALLEGGVVKRQAEVIAGQYKVCRKCEFRIRVPERNGFRECWGALADATPHVLELHKVTVIKSKEVPDPVPGLLAAGKASYLDLDARALGNGNSWHKRRMMQHAAMAAGGQEHLPEALRDELRRHEQAPGVPFHFLDFEACNISLPHHAGLRPYERVAFQFSCHTVGADGRLTHAEFLNTQRQFPNFLFAVELRKAIGERGTIYVWSSYEQSTLEDIARQLAEWRQREAVLVLQLSGLPDEARLDELEGWLHGLMAPDEAGEATWPRFRDLHALTEEYYFHPVMQGRTSIKVVLPGAWSKNERLRRHPWFAEYLKTDETGKILEPYATLAPLPLGEPDDEDEAVREGTGAVRVYQDMIFRTDQTEQERTNRQTLLKQYCKLDTAAMLFIHSHWKGLIPE